ncbi:MAG: hypothetical protein ACE5Q6_24155 [Dehalococcoidia bacterium]
MNKSFLVLLVLTLILGIGLGGAFIGGVAFGKTQQDETAPASPRLGEQQPGGRGGESAGRGGFGGRGDGQAQSSQTGGESGFGGRTDGGETSNAPGPGGFGGRRGGLAGTISSQQDGVLTIETPQGESRQVQLGEEITIQKSVEATPEDLTDGVQVRVIGQPDGEGTVQAQTIIILPEGAAASFGGGGRRGDRPRRGGDGP